MRLDEVTQDIIIENRMVWRKVGNAVRCTSGHRKGRVVSNAAQCSKPIDFKKRFVLKRTKAKMGSRMARKSRRTKRFNPASRRVASLNKRRR